MCYTPHFVGRWFYRLANLEDRCRHRAGRGGEPDCTRRSDVTFQAAEVDTVSHDDVPLTFTVPRRLPRGAQLAVGFEDLQRRGF